MKVRCEGERGEKERERGGSRLERRKVCCDAILIMHKAGDSGVSKAHCAYNK
jgi:hypothetical protein